jgi:thioredoxin 1
MALPETTDAQFETDVLKSDVPVLVDFGAVWCSPCKALKPVVEDLSKTYAGRVKMHYFDIGKHTKVPAQLGISSIPVLLIFKGGKERSRLIGIKPKGEIAKHLDAALAS